MARHTSEPREDERTAQEASDVVFDFTGLKSPGLTDLSLILTARLRSEPTDRVWVRALPATTWMVLRALRLAHLFRSYPGTSELTH